MATDIVLVPGYCEGPAAWRHVVPQLEKAGFKITTIKLLETGRPDSESPNSPSMVTIEVVRQAVEDIVDQGTSIALSGHSAGAVLGAHALQHLTPKVHEEAGKPGAVVKLAFIAGALFTTGYLHATAPFMDVQAGKKGDKLLCKDPRDLLFNDILDDQEAKAELERLTFQPGFGWDGTVKYAGWLDVPSAYLVCEKDA